VLCALVTIYVYKSRQAFRIHWSASRSWNMQQTIIVIYHFQAQILRLPFRRSSTCTLAHSYCTYNGRKKVDYHPKDDDALKCLRYRSSNMQQAFACKRENVGLRVIAYHAVYKI